VFGNVPQTPGRRGRARLRTRRQRREIDVVRYCRGEYHVARTYQLDSALIGIASRGRSERSNERKTNEFRIARIGRDLNHVPVQNDDLPL